MLEPVTVAIRSGGWRSSRPVVGRRRGSRCPVQISSVRAAGRTGFRQILTPGRVAPMNQTYRRAAGRWGSVADWRGPARAAVFGTASCDRAEHASG